MDPARPAYLIGVDGGGSGCRVAIADATGCVLAEAAGGPGNVSADPDQAAANIRAALDEAAAGAGIGADALRHAHAHLGLAGVMSEAEGEAMAARFDFARLRVTDDRPTVLAGALGGADGVVLAIGTGSFIARSRDGAARFVGGWGFVCGDQASGAWLGRGAVEAALLAVDGLREHGQVTRAVLGSVGGDPAMLAHRSLVAPPGWFAEFAPLVVREAAQGDQAGREMMERGADYICRALERLGRGSGEAVCAFGGVSPHYAPYLPEDIRDCVVRPLGRAVDGALRLAARLADG
ncbi:BadF/BadG/BcrA/BcrD ATPase family protein [Pontibaca methylaminivorans]|uniref:Glucosamine kinase n=1 Tax=Pontibaca methylaminivorans TaxID=515897 RepID=A0A1R3WZH7_9RHOB|nr:BadF/BadG/BcrA/BcrD ATPase family protein [Pontibaca methylaminivorans]SIT83746.1 glucosamine kinase [Pontibaca methylaminivorans]